MIKELEERREQDTELKSPGFIYRVHGSKRTHEPRPKDGEKASLKSKASDNDRKTIERTLRSTFWQINMKKQLYAGEPSYAVYFRDVTCLIHSLVTRDSDTKV